METRALHLATEEFASVLSKITAGDLALPTPCDGWDVGALYRHVLEENARFGRAVTGPIDDHGAPIPLDEPPFEKRARPDLGLEQHYRRTAAFMEHAFTSPPDLGQKRELAGVPGPRTVLDLYEMQLCDTVVHTWDLTQAIGLELDVGPDVAKT